MKQEAAKKPCEAIKNVVKKSDPIPYASIWQGSLHVKMTLRAILMVA